MRSETTVRKLRIAVESNCQALDLYQVTRKKDEEGCYARWHVIVLDEVQPITRDAQKNCSVRIIVVMLGRLVALSNEWTCHCTVVNEAAAFKVYYAHVVRVAWSSGDITVGEQYKVDALSLHVAVE
jgi:hypothetical protein